MTSGPSVNLYYSDRTTVPDRFAPSTTPLALSLVRPSAELPVSDSEGLLFGHARSYLDVDNRASHFDPSSPFLLAMTVHPQFTSSDSGQWTVMDTGQLTLGFSDGSFVARLGDRQVEMGPVTFGVNAAYPVAVAYDGSRLVVRTPWETRTQEDVHLLSDPPSALRLGGPLSGEGGSVRIRNLFLSQGRAADVETIETYWEDPASYAMPPGLDADTSVHTSANAILRMDPSLITPGLESVCPWGLIGGPAVGHDTQVWTPVPGDFNLRKGLLKFRPVKAAHLKMEFTNLSPLVLTPSQTTPIVKAKLFPADSGQGGSTMAGASSSESGAIPTGARVATEQGAVYQYVDARSMASVSSNAAYLPTEALYAPDPLDAQVLRRSGQRFPYQPLPGTRAPRFTSTGVHHYRVAEIAMDTKVGYTVALSQVLAYLSDPVAERDTEQYVELFHDTVYLSGYTDDDPSGWRHTGAAMVTTVTPPWLGTRFMSKTFVSKRRVLGVQFAAQASDSVQLVQDPDFVDPSLHFWRPVGDATIESSSRFSTSIGR
ncbi:hypothetical protein, partial [Streptomyces sp. NPDC056670]|uniref:hypothetical protein n=1 Tax=Streptomyces sp. NPDC056670 TaxID=3345904 RepID=UPI0036918CD2